jgi:hypothetical protein
MITATTCLAVLLIIFVSQQFCLSLAGLAYKNRKFRKVTEHRRIGVFIFSEKMEGNLRPLLLQFIHQEYPADKFKVHLVTSDRKNLDRFADLPVRVLMTYDTNRVANCRQALQQAEGVFDIAVSIQQPLKISDQYLESVNTGFQQGSYFVQPWLSRTESNVEIVPEPEGGFAAMQISIPLNNSIYSTPFLWLKQQLDEMKDIENFHHGLQYRMLEQGHTLRLLPGITATLEEQAISEKKGIINRLQFALKGFRLLLTGKPSMFFISIWKFQPARILMIPALAVCAFFNPLFMPAIAVYIASCILIMLKHPLFEMKKTTLNFSRQFEPAQFLPRRKRTSLAVSAAE